MIFEDLFKPIDASDLLVILKRQHELVSDLFKQLRKAERNDTREACHLYARMKISLVSHTHAEEVVLYRRMQGVPELRSVSFEGAEEHGLMDVIVKQLDQYSPDNHALWIASTKTLHELVAHHVREEERTVFPLIKRYFSEEVRKEMGVEFLRRQNEILEGETNTNFILPEMHHVRLKAAHIRNQNLDI